MSADRQAYPLEAVRTVRGAERDWATEALAVALRELEQARARRDRAAERVRVFRQAIQSRSVGERQCRAADLQAEARHRERSRAEEARLVDALAQRGAEVERAEAAAGQARAALARAEAGVQVVEKHRDGWVEDARRLAERRAEDERDDEAAARRTTSGDEFRSRFREP